MKVGIVGLPNVGKSTLFNAFLKRQQALSANYPFATIEPNVGVVDVIDERVDRLFELSKSAKKVYSNITFVDIAGIVEGAHKGEGLGNKFLSNIREVDLILVLLRDFNDENVVREGSVTPADDFSVILTELILKDLESVEKQASRLKRPSQDKTERYFQTGVAKIKNVLDKGEMASSADLLEEELSAIAPLQLLTSKPLLKVFNVSESDLSKSISEGKLCVSAKMESELSVLDEEDQKEFLSEFSVSESPLNVVIRKSYELLGLKTFLTTGELESRAWKFKDGMTAKECAGVIHTDFEKNFIKAEVISYDDYIEFGSKLKAKEHGKLRLEGKDYLFKDGDVVEFKVNA